VFSTHRVAAFYYVALSLKSRKTGGAPMTIPFGPCKEFVLKAAKTAIGFAKEHVQPSAKATTDGFTVTVHVRLKGQSRPLPTT
jgi:hypothetical protein